MVTLFHMTWKRILQSFCMIWEWGTTYCLLMSGIDGRVKVGLFHTTWKRLLRNLFMISDLKTTYSLLMSGINDCLCEDNLIEILHHLPSKSLSRFESVCKHWGKCIDDPSIAYSCRSQPYMMGFFCQGRDKLTLMNKIVFSSHRRNHHK
ncbi:hypothetical protein H5410_024794 [Solanum commersonii]|uniref:F-box domain-containing protein n=1 Tax=Solanum commersonii TaxID=4109 RepID=A0A9J5ZMY2_SOLCO|nr:hypothetical protein H5410_024794 [Solanum commersonii]